jgi:hypothetical protein
VKEVKHMCSNSAVTSNIVDGLTTLESIVAHFAESSMFEKIIDLLVLHRSHRCNASLFRSDLQIGYQCSKLIVVVRIGTASFVNVARFMRLTCFNECNTCFNA